MDVFLTIILFILIISSLVFVHELGHFLAAKLFKVKVEEFAIGFGKSIVSKKTQETVYKINIIPLGGYVKLEGENSKSIDKKGFRDKPFYVKFFVLISGILMNLVFSAILLNIYLHFNQYKFSILPEIVPYSFSNTLSQKSLFPLRVINIIENSNAYGILNIGDIIVSINGVFFKDFEKDFKQILSVNVGREIVLGLLDLNTLKINEVNMFLDEQKIKNDTGILGVNFSANNVLLGKPVYFLEYTPSIFAGFNLTFDIFFYQSKILLNIFSNAFSTGDFSEASESLGGLPAVTNQVSQIVQFRIFEFLIPFTAFISISLAFFNLIPIPALDGGQILLFFIETIFRKKIPDSVISSINFLSFLLLISLAIIINVKDIIQLGWIETLLNTIFAIFSR